MALIQCTECGAMISDKAKSCPKCGCPVEHDDQVEETSNRPRRIGKWILIAVIAILDNALNDVVLARRILSRKPCMKSPW